MADHSAIWWDELPEELQEVILSWLPVEYLCRFRCVSNQWNDIASSTKFITGIWSEHPQPNGRKPWLLLYNLNECRKPCAAYCFSTQTWKTIISLSFIGENENNEAGDKIYCHGSAAGLLLVEMRKRGVYSVCNPLTQKSFQLPAMISITCVAVTGIVKGEKNVENYRVVALGLGNNGGGQVVEIYDSSEKIWKIAGILPDNIQVWTTVAGMVFSNDDGFFYCRGNDRAGARGMIGFSMRDGTSVFIPLPDAGVELHVTVFFSQLFTCGSRVLILAGILQRNEDGINDCLRDVIIWQFQKDGDSLWKEIGRMPSALVAEIYRIIGVHGIFYSVGTRDCVCIKSQYCSQREVLVYNLSLHSWSWLSPTCPLKNRSPYIEYSTTIFEPRPDMKVG